MAEAAKAAGVSRSTVYGIPRRHGMSRLDHTDRPTGATIRYCRDHPGELVHIDVKKLGRIPEGGGWRKLGRTPATKRWGGGYDYLHAAVDDHDIGGQVFIERPGIPLFAITP